MIIRICIWLCVWALSAQALAASDVSRRQFLGLLSSAVATMAAPQIPLAPVTLPRVAPLAFDIGSTLLVNGYGSFITSLLMGGRTNPIQPLSMIVGQTWVDFVGSAPFIKLYREFLAARPDLQAGSKDSVAAFQKDLLARLGGQLSAKGLFDLAFPGEGVLTLEPKDLLNLALKFYRGNQLPVALDWTDLGQQFLREIETDPRGEFFSGRVWRLATPTAASGPATAATRQIRLSDLDNSSNGPPPKALSATQDELLRMIYENQFLHLNAPEDSCDKSLVSRQLVLNGR